eukprot:6817983-Ditylum_brightwellii.AAC.1
MMLRPQTYTWVEELPPFPPPDKSKLLHKTTNRWDKWDVAEYNADDDTSIYDEDYNDISLSFTEEYEISNYPPADTPQPSDLQ